MRELKPGPTEEPETSVYEICEEAESTEQMG